jgi:hypothetical protein
MKVQYNFRIEEEIKNKLDEIAIIESKATGLDVGRDEITRLAINNFIEEWNKKHKGKI